MRFLFFSKGNKNEASSRYRAYYLADALQELGHKASVTPVIERGVGAWWRYLSLLLSAKRDDVIFLQRTVYNKYFFIAVLISYLYGRRFIFDIDDAVYEHSPIKSAVLARLARVVTCGSEHILEWAKKQNKHSYLLFNGLPLAIYTKRTVEPEVFTIGWIGNAPPQYESVALIPLILRVFSSRGYSFQFKLIGALGDKRIHNLFKDMPFPVEIIDTLDWANPREAVAHIHTFTVGVMPLVGTDWNQAKYFKALEYMACGVPVVGSATETLTHIFNKAGAGFLVHSEEEWVEAFERLFTNQSLRTSESVRGRDYIEKFHSSKVMAQELLNNISG